MFDLNHSYQTELASENNNCFDITALYSSSGITSSDSNLRDNIMLYVNVHLCVIM